MGARMGLPNLARWMSRRGWTALVASTAAALAVAAWAPDAATAADLPQRPFLRVETGLHLNAIRRLAVSADGSHLATVSDDKTVRLWTLPDGGLSTTMRVPIDVGDEGALYAVALSPDGKRLLASGVTAVTWDGTPSLYLFDLERKILRFRLPLELSGNVNHIEYAPDGSVFAIAFGNRQGVQVRNASNGSQVGGDFGYGAMWIAFAPDGTMATSGDDGMIRLFDRNYRRMLERPAPRGDMPWAIAFSPDGRYLAVGYADKSRVDVLDARSLQRTITPDTRDIPGEYNLSAVGWLGNERSYRLMAAGSMRDRQGRATVRVWDIGTNRYEDWVAAPSEDLALTQISQIAPIPGQTGMVFASVDAAWGLLDGNGRLRFQRRGVVADFRDIEQGRFGVSADGMTVDFGMAQGGALPFRFDVRARQLTANPSPSPSITPPLIEGRRLKVSGWKNDTSPRLNGVELTDDRGRPLSRLGYLFRSLAVAPDERSFVLGAEYSLHLFDASGRELKRVDTESPVWGVVVAENNRVAVAAMRDGTLVWYSLDRGRELERLASLFPHPDGETWVMWIPEGLFDHSDVGSPNYVGFHLNGPEMHNNPTWVDFSQAYRSYYTPRIGELRLSGTGEEVIRERLATVGNLRQQVTDLPRPTVELAEYCIVPEGTRAFRRRQESQSTAQAAAVPAPAAADRQCFTLAGKALSRASGLATRAFKRRDPAAPAQQAAAPGPAPESAPTTIELPPGARTIELAVKVTDNGGGIGNVDVLLNERIVDREQTRAFSRVKPPQQQASPERPAAQAGAAQELRRVITLDPAATNIVQARAFREDGLFSELSGQVQFALPADRSPPPESLTRRLFLVSIGVSAYQRSDLRLTYPARDATTVGEAMKAGAGGLFDEVIHETLLDRDVTRESVRSLMERVGLEARNRDTVIIYIAGHGVVDDATGRELYYFIPHDVTDSVESRGLSERELLDALAGIQARGFFLFLDTCHSGAVAEVNWEQAFGNLSNELMGRYILAAASRDQPAFDKFDSSNGPMAHWINEALQGQGRDDIVMNGVIWSSNLGFWVRRQLDTFYDEKEAAGSFSVQSYFKILGNADNFEIASVRATPVSTRSGQPDAPMSQPPAGQPDAAEIAFWQTVTAGNTPQEYQLYLQVYPNGHFAPIARLRAGLSAQ